MKSKKLSEQIRQCAALNRGIVLPSGQRTYRSWPVCLTCFREVDVMEVKDVSSTGCELLAKCSHVKPSEDPENKAPLFEDFYRVTFPVRLDGDPFTDERNNWAFKRAVHDFCPFDPTHVFDSSVRKP